MLSRFFSFLDIMKGRENRRVYMKVRFVSRGKLKGFKDNYESEGEGLILFGFDGMGEVSYEKELKGESSSFEEAALLSKEGKTVVVCGCITDTRGLKRKSAVVAEKGRLCGVSDMLNAMDNEVSVGGALRIYETFLGRMGLVVGEDILFPEVIKSLTLCGCDFIVCPFGKVSDTVLQTLLRAYAYLYGVPILLCGIGYSWIVDPFGQIAFASPQNVLAEFECVKEYHLIETRRRGIRKAPLL